MNNQTHNNYYSECKERVRLGTDSWDNIFFPTDKKQSLITYQNLSKDAREEKAAHINHRHKLLALLATASDNTKWLIDLALQNCEKEIKKYSSKEYRWEINIDRLNGIKPKQSNYYNLQLIKAVPIDQFLQSGQCINGDKSLHLCPLHNEKTPSFHYYKKQNTFACYGCGKAGDNIQFIMELHKYSFKEACAYLQQMI